MNTVTVVGEAFDELAPDKVEWTLILHDVDAAPRVAFDRCTTRLNAVAAALATFEVTTSQIGFEPEWHSSGHKTTGRQIAEAALVVTAAIEHAAAVATTAMDAGADELRGPRLKYPDAQAALDALLPRAVEAARRNADAIAAAAGRKAGRVLSVTDPNADAEPHELRRVARRRRGGGEFAAAASGGGEGDPRGMPVIARPQRLSAALIVVFELTD